MIDKLTQTTFLFVCIPTRHLNVARTGQAGDTKVGAGDGQPAWSLRPRLPIPTVRMSKCNSKSKGKSKSMD